MKRSNESERDSIANKQIKLSKDSDKSPHRAGKIIQIRLRNFMCHSNLIVDFNIRSNLIVGNNGSGKSAVITALILGLGSKASTTSRSKSIKQLIMRGESSATIEIVISNDGDSPYEIEKYGNKICVIRHITQSGSSTYKLKSAQGTVISTKREDLTKLTLFLNIQVDNPVCLLTQDSSRSFLKESDPKKRYHLFLKATQIETVIEKLNACKEHYRCAEKRLNYQVCLTEPLKQAVDETTDKYQRLQSAGYLKTELKALKREQQWMLVLKQEELCKEMEETLNRFTAELNQLKETCRNKANIEQEINDKIAKINDELRVIENDLDRLRINCDQHRIHLQDKNEVLQAHMRLMKKNESKIKQIKADIQQLQEDICERSQTQTSRIAKMKMDNETKVLELKQKETESHVILENLKRDVKMLSDTREIIEMDHRQIRDKRNNISIQRNQISVEIQKFSTSDKNSLLIYGNYMPAFVIAIKNHYNKGGFSEMPRGPFSQYIEVTDEKWKAPIETIIGHNLLAFCVNNVKDRNELNKIIKTSFPAARSLPIITTKFHHKVYDVQSGAVKEIPNTHLVMNVIKCSDAVVMNCLIDQQKIETILLCEDQDLAERLTCDEENVPRNLSKIMLTKPSAEYYPAPMYRTYSTQMRPVRYIQINMEQRRLQLSQELNRLQDEQYQIDEQMKILQMKLKEKSQVLNQKQELEDTLENELRFLRTNIVELENVEYPPENEAEILNQELLELEKNLERYDKTYQTDSQRLVDLKAASAAKENEISAMKIEIKKVENDVLQKKNEMDELHDQLGKTLTQSKYIDKKVKSMDENVAALKVEHHEALVKQQRLEGIAQKSGDRIVSERSQDEIDSKIKSMNLKLKTISEITDNILDVAQLLAERKAEYEKSIEQASKLKETLQLLHKSRIRRYKKVNELKAMMSEKVSKEFKAILKLRNYTGEMILNHDEQLLELHIVPRDKHINSAVSNATCLSGGERSYSTVAFLLALWACVDHPFYFLDEYDVYTDQVNRHYMTRLLLNEGATKPHRQYAFLTPQDMSEITANEIITIHRLADPVRN